MTKAELRSIAEDLIDDLREMPDGTEMTSLQLLKDGGYDPQNFGFSELVDYHQDLLREAKANHITLDMSKQEDKEEGSPYNLDFVVRNKKAQIKCPYCGSKNTARILYGMPVLSEGLMEKLDSGIVLLGGCCLHGVDDGNGRMITMDPARCCNDCHKRFASPPYLISKAGHMAEVYADIVTGIKFSVEGYSPISQKIEIIKRQDGVFASADPLYSDSKPVRDHHITNIRWMRLLDRLYTELYLHEWKKNYETDEFVLDGEQWTIEISLTNRRKRTYHGDNAYPPYWPEFQALLRNFVRGLRK